MKLHPIVLFIPLFFCFQSNAQIVAGEVPEGYTLLNIDISVDWDTDVNGKFIRLLNFTTTTDQYDMNVHLAKGTNQHQDSRELSIAGNNGWSLCSKDFSDEQRETQLYSLGETLSCEDQFNFDAAPNPNIEGTHHLITFDETYYPVAPLNPMIGEGYVFYELFYENNFYYGWMEISYDLTGDILNCFLHRIILPEIMEPMFTVDVENIETPSSINLFPNPTTDFVTLDSETRIESVQIYNLKGQLLSDRILVSNKVELPKIQGILILKCIRQNGEVVVKRVLKN